MEWVAHRRELCTSRSPVRSGIGARSAVSMEAQTWLADVLSLHTLRQRTDRAADDLARAEELDKQALAASPRNSHAHYDKAQILRRAQGRCREAIPEYETVISLNPNFGSAYANLGWCKFLTGSIEDVIPLRKRPCASLPAAPSSTLCIYGLGRHICRSRITKTRSAGWRRPRNATLWPAEERSYLASAYALTGQNERAAVELAEARRMSPDDRYSSIARLRAVEHYGASKIRDLREATYFAGLRKAGMPEE
jgi:tetratricopeptide (TPR) repeat protein